jgi:6-phosphogluconolactonase (cycloisomerase 2 family)
MFVVNDGLETYTIDQDTGALTFSEATSLAGSSRPGESIFITPDGSRLICTDLDSGIYIADINDATGALTLVPTAPQNVVGFIASVEINRAGDRLYVYEDPHIYGYSITAAGELTALPNMPYNNAGSQFYSMRIDEYDQFLFAMSVSGDQVHVFEILDDGSLQEHIESPIANANPAGVPVQLITVP